MSPAPSAPPEFLVLAGDPVRWGLLTTLARGDARVGELCGHLDLRQNLASYHLARLRSAGLVRSRRSTADGRDHYYMLDLARCAEMLGQAAGTLHPGLADAVPRPTGDPQEAPATPMRILFACTGNSARSRMAEAIANTQGSGWVLARSAGSHPKPLHPNAARVLAEGNVTAIARASTHLDAVLGASFDLVVTLCDRVRESCPEFPAHPMTRHWSIPDPAGTGDADDETYPAFVATRDEIETRVRFLLAELRTRPAELAA